MTHSHSHSEDHHHAHHSHEIHDYNFAFIVGISLNIIFVVVEVFYGFLSNSSALLADAGHNAGDVMSLVLAWVAIKFSARKPWGKYTYGLRKSTIMASMINAILLFAAIGMIAYDSILKLNHPREIDGNQVMIVAGIGVIINTITALLFYKGQHHDLNIKGAFLHMTADAAVSLGVVISGFLILKTGLNWIDTLMSFLIIAVIFWSTWKLFKESVNLALDAAPDHIKIEDIEESILKIEDVEALHDLHVWAMSTSETALTAHVIIAGQESDAVIKEIQKVLNAEFHIHHSTIQVESQGVEFDCRDCKH